jgi:hypothetical protein
MPESNKPVSEPAANKLAEPPRFIHPTLINVATTPVDRESA